MVRKSVNRGGARRGARDELVRDHRMFVRARHAGLFVLSCDGCWRVYDEHNRELVSCDDPDVVDAWITSYCAEDHGPARPDGPDGASGFGAVLG